MSSIGVNESRTWSREQNKTIPIAASPVRILRCKAHWRKGKKALRLINYYCIIIWQSALTNDVGEAPLARGSAESHLLFGHQNSQNEMSISCASLTQSWGNSQKLKMTFPYSGPMKNVGESNNMFMNDMCCTSVFWLVGCILPWGDKEFNSCSSDSHIPRKGPQWPQLASRLPTLFSLQGYLQLLPC